MTLLQERLPDFPENPSDGFQITEQLPDGSIVTWTYNAQFNEWTYTISGAPSNQRVYSENVVLSRPVTKQGKSDIVDQYKILGPSVIGDPTGRYGQHEANELFLYNDTDLQSQVDKLDEKVDAIIAGTTHAKWRFDTQPGLGTWKWDGSSDNDYNQAASQLDISKTDLSGKGYDPADFRVGDELHITNADGSGHLWATIDSIVDGGPGSMELTYTKVDAVGVATGEQIFSIKAELDEYVRKEGGDTMEGPLQIEGGRDPGNAQSSLIALNIDSGQNSDLQLRHDGAAKVYVGKESVSINPKVILSGNEIRYKTNGTKIVSEETGRENLTLNKNGVFYRGDSTSDEHLINKGYSDHEDLVLDAKIAELRVEMDALAPINAAGIWRWQDISSPRPPSQGQFVLLNKAGDGTVDQYGDSGAIWVHQTDWENATHGFGTVAVGELIQLFDRYEPEFVLGEITSLQDNNMMPDGSGSLIIFYDVERFNGGPDYGSGADPLVNIKIYSKPTDIDGQTAYLPVKGGTMQGNIVMDNNKIRFNSTTQTGDHIHFTREAGDYARLLRLDHTGGSEHGGYDIRLGGNTNYNMLRLMGGSNGDEVCAQMRANGRLELYRTLYLNSNTIKDVAHAVHDDEAVNLGQVKEALTELRDEFLQDLIVGTWFSDNFNSLTAAGVDRMVTVKGTGQKAEMLSQVDIIRFHYKDNRGGEVQWDHWDPGEIITLRSTEDPSVYATYRLKSAVSIAGDTRSFTVEFINAQNDSTSVFTYYTQYAVTLTEFSDGFNGADLDNLYLRTDGSNGPIKDELEISTGADSGAAALVLTGRRTGTTNNSGAIAFKNALQPGYTGYFGWKCDANGRWFNVSDDLDLNSNGLHSVTRIRFPHNLPFSIESKDGSNTYQRMHCRFPANANEGNAALEFDRYSTNVRRGFSFRGYRMEGTSRVMGDVLWSYLNSSGADAVNYNGKTDGSDNIQTKASVEALINKAYVLDEEGEPHFYDHRLEDVGHPVAATDAATKGYVDAVAGQSGPEARQYKFYNKGWRELTDGQFTLLDANGNSRADIAGSYGIAFKAVDQDGNRIWLNNSNVDWTGFLGGALKGLNSAQDKNYFYIAGPTVKVQYLNSLDLFYLSWTDTSSCCKTSTYSRYTNGGTTYLACPGLFI